MPKPIKKVKPAHRWPAPKRGVARSRAQMKKAEPMKSTGKNVPYVRHHTVMKKFIKKKHRWGISVETLLSTKGVRLLALLRKAGLLQSWAGKPCRHCGQGKMGSLFYEKSLSSWTHRCSRKGCQRFVRPQDFHPIFFGGSGASVTSLNQQAAALCCAVAGVPQASAHLILDMDNKPVGKIYRNLEVARARHVRMKEKDVLYGSQCEWPDVEADEVDLGKELVLDASKAKWEQWGGIVERGRPDTLMLFRLKPRLTTPRSPGPGAIRRRDWEPIARKHLLNRSVVLHTDGARAYKLKLPGVLHDNVVHKKKKIQVNGKNVWVRPHYTKICSHTLPSGKKLKVKSGTQIIDRIWGHIRSYLKYTPRNVGSKDLERKIRSAQWTHWHKDCNQWEATGSMVTDLMQ